jgi:predicted transcriptional regulator
MNSLISSLMNRQVHVIDMDDTVAQVETLFDREGLTWAPVVEGKRAMLGVISAADLLQFHARQQDANAVRAWQLCTYKPITVPQDAQISDVARLMAERNIHHVVVIDSTGIAGVMSSMDFVRTFVRD